MSGVRYWVLGVRGIMKNKQGVESWKDLEVWQKAHQLVLEVYRLTKVFPSEERYRLVDQLCRASASIPTNIAEGKGRNSLKEYLQFLSIAKGSIEETKYLLLLSRDLGYLDEPTYYSISDNYDEIARMINGLINSLRTYLTPKTCNPIPMANIVIHVENLGKRYRIGQRERYYALRDIIAGFLSAPLRLFHRPTSNTHIWELRDVSFEVNRGEVVGIIGRNGA